MRVLTVFFLTVLFVLPLSAQFGVRVKYNSDDLKEQNSIVKGLLDSDEDVLTSGYEVALDYWFRLSEKRIEFLPEVGYAITNGNEPASTEIMEYRKRNINFNLNTRFYLLDFNSDCDCPTFSKQGDVISKGFYFVFSPGASYQTLSLDGGSLENEYTLNKLIFKVGLGAGLDIGFSDLITINPYVMYNYFPSNDYIQPFLDTDPILDLGGYETDMTQLQFGLRVAMRPDYESPSFGRR